MNNLKVICPFCKKAYEIPLERELVRTLPMNRLYWGVYISIIAEELGYFPEELHEELKLKFNAKDSKISLGKKYGGTTTRMTRKEFSRYLEDIKNWAFIEHGIILPDQEKEIK